jgi:hypothetical protein
MNRKLEPGGGARAHVPRKAPAEAGLQSSHHDRVLDMLLLLLHRADLGGLRGVGVGARLDKHRVVAGPVPWGGGRGTQWRWQAAAPASIYGFGPGLRMRLRAHDLACRRRPPGRSRPRGPAASCCRLRAARPAAVPQSAQPPTWPGPRPRKRPGPRPLTPPARPPARPPTHRSCLSLNRIISCATRSRKARSWDTTSTVWPSEAGPDRWEPSHSVAWVRSRGCSGRGARVRGAAGHRGCSCRPPAMPT